MLRHKIETCIERDMHAKLCRMQTTRHRRQTTTSHRIDERSVHSAHTFSAHIVPNDMISKIAWWFVYGSSKLNWFLTWSSRFYPSIVVCMSASHGRKSPHCRSEFAAFMHRSGFVPILVYDLRMTWWMSGFFFSTHFSSFASPLTF